MSKRAKILFGVELIFIGILIASFIFIQNSNVLDKIKNNVGLIANLDKDSAISAPETQTGAEEEEESLAKELFNIPEQEKLVGKTEEKVIETAGGVTTSKWQELSTNIADYEGAKGVAITFEEKSVTGEVSFLWPDNNGEIKKLTYDASSLSGATIYIPKIEFEVIYKVNTIFNTSNIEAYYDEKNISNITTVESNDFGNPGSIYQNTLTLWNNNYKQAKYFTLYETEEIESGNTMVSVFAGLEEDGSMEYEDGSRIKFYSVPSDSVIKPEDFITPENTNRREFNCFYIIDKITFNSRTGFYSDDLFDEEYNVSGSTLIYGTYDDAVIVDYYELSYNEEAKEVVKDKVATRTIRDGYIYLPEMSDKEGYFFSGWRAGYSIDEYGLNLFPYERFSENYYISLDDIPNEVYCTYIEKGNGPLKDVYISNDETNNTMGNDANTGTNPYDSVYSLDRAYQLLAEDGTIHVAGTVYITYYDPTTSSYGGYYDDNLLIDEFTLEGYGENAKFLRGETCKNAMFYIIPIGINTMMGDSEGLFLHDIIINGNGENIRSDEGMIMSAVNLTLADNTVLENNKLSPLAMETMPSYVDGGSAIKVVLGSKLTMYDGAIIRNNSVIYREGDTEQKHDWINSTELVELPENTLLDSSAYADYEGRDVTFKISASNVKDMLLFINNDEILKDDVIIYDKMYNPTYYFYKGEASLEGSLIYGDTAYIRFPNGITSGSTFKIEEIFDITPYVTTTDNALAGGAIALDQYGATMEMNGGNIYGNSAYWGGAIYVGPENRLVLNGGHLYENEAQYGGAIYMKDHQPVTVSSSGMPKSLNSMSLLLQAAPDIELTLIKNFDKLDVVINDVEIYDNTAEVDGGGIYVDAALLQLNNGKIYNNTAKNAGGGIYINNQVCKVSGFSIYFFMEEPAPTEASMENIEESSIIKSATKKTDVQKDVRPSYNYKNIPGTEIPSTLEMNGGEIYTNTAYVGGGIYNANKCLLKQGDIYNNNVTKNVQETENYGGSAIYAFEDVVIYPEIKVQGDVRVCADEGANIVTPNGLNGYESYNPEDENIIDISVEENIAHEDYAVVKGRFSKYEKAELTDEQVNCPEKAQNSKCGKEEDGGVNPDDNHFINYRLDINDYLLTKKYGTEEKLGFYNYYDVADFLFEEIDGVYESTNEQDSYSNAYMTTKEFEIKETGNIKFDWSISASKYSHLSYEIYNEEGYIVTSKVLSMDSQEMDKNNLDYITETSEQLEPGKYYVQFEFYTSNLEGLSKAFIKNMKYTDGDSSFDLIRNEKELVEKENAGLKEENGIYVSTPGWYVQTEIYHTSTIPKQGTYIIEYTNSSETAPIIIGDSNKMVSLDSTVEDGEVTWKTIEYEPYYTGDSLYIEYYPESETDQIKLKVKYIPYEYEYPASEEKGEESEDITFGDLSYEIPMESSPLFREEDGVYISRDETESSNLVTEELKLEDTATLSFDYAISAHADNELIVSLFNLDTMEETSCVTLHNEGEIASSEDELVYIHKEISIPKGNYHIEMIYNKISEEELGLNRAYVKNIKLDGEDVKVLTINELIGFDYEDGIYTSSKLYPISMMTKSDLIIKNNATLEIEYLLDDYSYSNNQAAIIIINKDTQAKRQENLNTEADWKKVQIPLPAGNYAVIVLYSALDAPGELKVKSPKLVVREYGQAESDLNRLLETYDLQHVEYVGNFGWGLKLNTEENEIQLTKEIEITKEWVDEENKANIRPTSITAELFKDGVSQGDIEIKASEGWKYKVKEAGREDYDKNPPVYTLKEKEIEQYESSQQTLEDGNIILTNTIKEFKISTGVEGEGGDISGNGEVVYEEVKYGEDTVKQIKITPEPGYRVNTIKINDVIIDFTEEDDHTVILDQLSNITEDKHVVVSFARINSNVLVYYYIAYKNEDGTYTYTTEKVPSKDYTDMEEKIISGYVGDPYEVTMPDNIANEYTYLETRGDTKGTFVEGGAEVIIYYVLKDTNVVTNEVTKTGTTIIEDESDIVSYKITYTSEIKTYKGKATLTLVDNLPYEIDESQSDLDGGTYDKESKTITWTVDLGDIDTFESGEDVTKEISVEKNITIKYINIDTSKDKLTNNVVSTLNLVDQDKQIKDGDDFDTTVSMQGEVVVKYVDKYTNEEISDEVRSTGKIGTNFDISNSKKDIDGYTLIEEPAEKTGTYTKDTQTKIYYYAKNTSVHVTYIDKLTNKEIASDETIEGYEKLHYQTEKKVINNYSFVEDSGNTEGEMTRDVIEVKYYYIKMATVRVQYVNKINNEKIADDVIIEGHENEEYKTEQKDIEGYKFVEVKGDTEGLMDPDNEIVVTYYYVKPAKVIVKYLEKETEKELSEEETIDGYEGDEYETSAKEIEYYDLLEEPENKSGEMKDTIYVTYYYEKKKVDFSVDKTIDSLQVNGEYQDITDNDLVKAEVYRKSTNSTNIRIVYNIEVRNEGEIGGTVTLLEEIPEYLTMSEKDNKGWTISNNIATLETEAIEPGRTKTYKVVMTWKKGDGHFGMQTNKVSIQDINTPSGFEDINQKNDSDEADVLISISTGVESISGILMIVLAILLVILFINRRYILDKIEMFRYKI